MKRQHQSSEDASTSKMPSAKRSKPSENNNIVTPSQLDDLALDGPANEQISGPSVEAGVEKLKKKKSEKKKEKIKALEQQIKEFETKICLKENQNAQLQLKFDNLSKQCKYFEQKSQQVETQNADYRKIIKAKEDSNSEQQRNHEKLYQKWEAEKQKFDLKLEQLENEFRGTLKAKDDEIGGLKNELEEIRQEMFSKQNDIYQANFENENLLEELSKAGDEIENLKGQKGVTDKNVNQPVVKNMEVELAEARSKCKSFEAQMKIQRDSYELKLEAAKAENQSLSALNYQIKSDKEKYEKEISLLQKSVEELQKLVQEESNTCNHFRNRYLELVNERTTKNGQLYQLKNEINEVKQYCKNVEQMILDEKTKLQKIGAELYKLEKELDEKINLFTSLNSKIKAEKEKIEKEFAEYQTFINNRNLNVFTPVSTQSEDTVSSSTEATAPSTAAPTTTTTTIANKKGPKWIISKEICKAILETSPKVIDFLKQYTSIIFNSAESLLPEDRLNPVKWREAILVLMDMFKLGEKSLCVDLLQKEMKCKRNSSRSEAYKKCGINRAYGICNNERKIYFLLQSNNHWEPFNDKEGEEPIQFNIIPNSTFCFPTDALIDFIVIASKHGGECCIYKMTSSLLQCLFKKSCTSEKKPAV